MTSNGVTIIISPRNRSKFSLPLLAESDGDSRLDGAGEVGAPNKDNGEATFPRTRTSDILSFEKDTEAEARYV